MEFQDRLFLSTSSRCELKSHIPGQFADVSLQKKVKNQENRSHWSVILSYRRLVNFYLNFLLKQKPIPTYYLHIFNPTKPENLSYIAAVPSSKVNSFSKKQNRISTKKSSNLQDMLNILDTQLSIRLIHSIRNLKEFLV